MKSLSKTIILLLLIISASYLCSCQDYFGGISINKNIIINETTIDTNNLKLIAGDVTKDYDYSIKIMGYTNPVDDRTWNTLFKDEQWDISGKIVVCIQLEYPDTVAMDNDATITIKPIDSKNETIISINELIHTEDQINNVLIFLNPRHDQVDLTIDYSLNQEHKDIKYHIDLMDVNTNTNSQA